MNEKVFVGPKFGTLIHRKWITNVWVVTRSFQRTEEEMKWGHEGPTH
jgi:hypothetical protein